MMVSLACVKCKAKLHVLRSHAHLPSRCPKCGGMLTGELRRTQRHPLVGRPIYICQRMKREKIFRTKLAVPLVALLLLVAGVWGYWQWESGETSKLVNQLSATDESVYVSTLERLVEKGKKAVPALINALASDNENVQTRAQEALARIGKPAIKPLVNLIAREENGLYRSAASVLKRLSNASNLPEMLELFQGTSSIRVQEVIADGFAELADVRCLQALLKALYTEDDDDYNAEWNVRMDTRLRTIVTQVTGSETDARIDLPEAIGEKESWLLWWQTHSQHFQ